MLGCRGSKGSFYVKSLCKVLLGGNQRLPSENSKGAGIWAAGTLSTCPCSGFARCLRGKLTWLRCSCFGDRWEGGHLRPRWAISGHPHQPLPHPSLSAHRRSEGPWRSQRLWTQRGGSCGADLPSDHFLPQGFRVLRDPSPGHGSAP